MNFLFDTNVVSELGKAEPNRRVSDWVGGLRPDSAYISVITLGEIRRGVESLPEGSRREQLSLWLDQDLPARFEGNILDVDLATADLWGKLTARSKRTLPAIDTLIAATALAHNLKLVTRNVKDFDIPNLSVVNPWES